MKRICTFLLALILVLGLALPAFGAEQPTLTLTADKASLAPGQTVTVTLTLDQALSGLNNYQFNVLFDAARFELTGSTVGGTPTVVSAPRKDERTGADCITVSGLSTTGAEVSLASVKVAELTFKALDTAELGEAEFTVSVQALPQYDDPTRAVELAVVNEATVTIGEATAVMKGDVTGDGKITVSDVTFIRGYLKKTRTLNERQMEAAKVTKDDNITIADVTFIRRYIKKDINKFPIEEVN